MLNIAARQNGDDEMNTPEGWPTEEMRKIGNELAASYGIYSAVLVFKAMLAAAPTPPLDIPQDWPTDEMVVRGGEILHDLGVRFESESSEEQQELAEKLFIGMAEAAPTPPAQETLRSNVRDLLYRTSSEVSIETLVDEILELISQPAQEAEPVGYISQSSFDKLTKTKCNVGVYVWRECDKASPRAIYTCPQPDELRKAAEEFFAALETCDLDVVGIAQENLRKVLERKS